MPWSASASALGAYIPLQPALGEKHSRSASALARSELGISSLPPGTQEPNTAAIRSIETGTERQDTLTGCWQAKGLAREGIVLVYELRTLECFAGCR
jgi:hypothetical protein